MSETRLMVLLGLDTSEIDTGIDQTAKKADAVVSKWRIQRQELEREIRGTLNSISQVIGLVRQAISTFGLTLNPWFQSLFAMVSSTISTLLAIGLAFASNPVTGAWAPIIFGAAALLSIFQTGKLVGEFIVISNKVAGIQQRLTALAGRTTGGVSHAFGGGGF